MTKKKYIVLLSLLFPILIFAQTRLQTMLTDFRTLLNRAIPIIFGLTMVYFFWHTANFILNDAGNEKTRQEGVRRIVWGVVVIFVFISLYGILNAISGLIDISP